MAYARLQKSLEGKPRTPIDGFTPEQRFFLGFASVWCQNVTERGRAPAARADGSALAGPVPRQRHHLEHAGVPEGLLLQGGPADGAGERLPGVVSVTHVSATRRAIPLAVALAVLSAGQALTQPPSPATTRTQVVLLGTGTPPADPDRSGPATAVVVNDTPYLVDIGAGVVRRAKSAVVDKGIAGLDPVKLRTVFVTHLHSDHTVGYPDLILTPWVIGRRVPLEVHGPTGIKAMTEHLLEAYRADFETRTKDRGLYTVGAFPEGHAVNAHEVRPGVVYKDANVTVTAFATKHAMESYGYRFDTRRPQRRHHGRHQSRPRRRSMPAADVTCWSTRS